MLNIIIILFFLILIISELLFIKFNKKGKDNDICC